MSEASPKEKNVLGGPLLARLPLVPLSAALLAAYLGALAAEGTWVALSPLGPTQNGRFFGLSNLLETLLLVPALVGASRRAAFLPVAILATVMVVAPYWTARGGTWPRLTSRHRTPAIHTGWDLPAEPTVVIADRRPLL